MFDDIQLGSEEDFDDEGFEPGFPDDLRELFEKDPDDALDDIDFGEEEAIDDDLGLETSAPEITDNFEISSGGFKKYDTQSVLVPCLFSASSVKKR